MITIIVNRGFSQGPLFFNDCGTDNSGSNNSFQEPNVNPDCNDSYLSGFMNKHSQDAIPQGVGKIKIRTNVIIVQDANGEGNFSLSNPAHVKYFDDIFKVVNERLQNIVEESCNCSTAPTHYDKFPIEFDYKLYELRNSTLWNHRNDPTPGGFNSGTSDDYLDIISDEAASLPGYEEGFDVIITTDGDQIDNIKNNPGSPPWIDYDPVYKYGGVAVMYSSYPKFGSGKSKKAFWHAPDVYIHYLAEDYKGGQQNIDNYSVPLIAGNFLHEYFHYLDLDHKYCDKNIMHPSGSATKRVSLTGCQIRTMWKALMGSNVAKYVECDLALDHAINIVEDEEWTMDARIYNNVVVKPGATLTIKCKLEMNPNVQFIVEQGGRLIVDGALLTSCDVWKGIMVAGRGAPDFDVKITGGATIENIQSPGVTLSNNAKIIANQNSTFQNISPQAIAFLSFVPGWNTSVIEDCNFIDVKAGVTSWNCNGITVKDNSFSVREQGLITIDGSFNPIEGNSFNGGTIGMLLMHSHPGLGGSIKNNILNGCTEGIRCVGATIGKYDIKNNTFACSGIDIFMDGANNNDVNHNNFSAPWGVHTNAVGIEDNLVRFNSFDGDLLGIFSVNFSYGLLFTQNCFNTTQTDVFINQTVYPHQKTTGGAAGNCFTHQGQWSSVEDIDGNMDFFTYYTNDDQVIDCYDVRNTGNFDVERDDPVSAIGCGTQQIIPDPGECDYIPDEGERIIAEGELRQWILDAEQDPNLSQEERETLIAQYNICLSRVLGDRASYAINMGDFTAARALLSGEASVVEPELNLFGMSMLAQDWSTAQSDLNSIPSNMEGISDFKTIEQINLIRVQDPENYVADQQTLQQVYDISVKSHPYAAYAKSLYYILTGDLVLSGYAQQGNTPRIAKRHTSKITELMIYPNPVKDVLQIKFKSENTANIRIIDMFGYEVMSKTGVTGNLQVTTNSWHSGLYTVIFENGADEPIIRKMILSK